MFKTAYIFGIPLMYTKDIYNGSCLRHKPLYIYIFCKHQWDPKDVRSFKHYYTIIYIFCKHQWDPKDVCSFKHYLVHTTA